VIEKSMIPFRYKMHRSRKPSRVSLPQSVRVSLNVIR